MSQNLNDFAEAIITYQKKHDKTDGEMAFGTRISVERFHAIKSGEIQPTAEEGTALNHYMSTKH